MLAERAKTFIEAQGFMAYDTPDGLLVLSPEISTVKEEQWSNRWCGVKVYAMSHSVRSFADHVCEEPTVFPVYYEVSPIDGFAVAHVDGKAVRNWLGY